MYLLRQGAGESGLFGRWGGEEFVILIPNVDGQVALKIADQIRVNVRDHIFTSDNGHQIRITISFGIALYPHDAQDLFTLFALADRAAYMAKKRGKDRACSYQECVASAAEPPKPDQASNGQNAYVGM